MGIIDAPNKVPQHQRSYQAAYRGHTRIWRIGPRATAMYVPFVAVMWLTTAATLYGGARKVAGYNSFFGSK